MDKITFTLAQPDKVVKSGIAHAVVLPAVKGNLTVIPERAPCTVLLDNGVVQILNSENKVVEAYFVKSGIAHIADNSCMVACEIIINKNGITKPEAKINLDEVAHAGDKAFYRMVFESL